MNSRDRLANLEHPPVVYMHQDESTIGGPHPIPGAVFNINLLKRHTADLPVRAPLREGADMTFTYINGLDHPRTMEGGVIGEFASACLNPLSTKIGDLVNYNPLRTMKQFRAHEAVYDGLEALTGDYRTIRTREDIAPVLAS